MSDSQGTRDTTKQQNILLVISEDGTDVTTENTFKGYAVIRWPKDIIKRGAYLTKTNIFNVFHRLLRAFTEKSGDTLISEILLADENDEKDNDTEEGEASGKEDASYDDGTLSRASDYRDMDEETLVICR